MKSRQRNRLLVTLTAFGSLFASSFTWANMMDCSGTKRSKVTFACVIFASDLTNVEE